MTGPEHYAEAERLMANPQGSLYEAQVHATLALAAATVGTSNYASWQAVASNQPRESAP